MRVIDIAEAAARLSNLVEEAARGDSFIIATDGKPLVKVTAIEPAPSDRPRGPRLGFLAGRFTVPDDFDRMDEEEIRRMFEDGDIWPR